MNPARINQLKCYLLFIVILAGMKLCDMDEDNSLLSMTPSQDGIPPPDPLRVDWPKVSSSSVYEMPSPQ